MASLRLNFKVYNWTRLLIEYCQKISCLKVINLFFVSQLDFSYYFCLMILTIEVDYLKLKTSLAACLDHFTTCIFCLQGRPTDFLFVCDGRKVAYKNFVVVIIMHYIV